MIEKRKVISGVFCISGYEINYSDNKAKVQGKCTEEELKLNRRIKLSETSGYYIYPTSRTFEVIENISGGLLSCESSDEEIATCSISGTTVTVTPGTAIGTATLTIKSEGSSKYTDAQAAYVVTTKKGLLSYTANGYSGVYDGESHGITVTSSGATINYGTSDESYDLTSSPTYIDAGTYTVYYQITKTGYQTVTGSKTVVISKADGSATLSETSGTVYAGKSTTFTVGGATGTLSCSTDNPSVATCSISGKTVTVTAVANGTANITVNVAESTNYNEINEIYEVTVVTPSLSDLLTLGDYIKMTPTSTSYTISTSLTGYTSDQTINPSELNLWRVISINSDGTIDVVSEYVSSVVVYLKGKTGFKNLVGTLNTIAKQYENSKYTVGSRYMGYNGQTEYLTDTDNTVDSTGRDAPWTSSTVDNSNESKGGGDIMYATDTNLEKTVLGTLSAYDVSATTSKKSYFLASRNYYYSDSKHFSYREINVSTGGLIETAYLVNYNNAAYELNDYSKKQAIRPIVTLKSGLQATGSGTQADPYVLE